VRWRKRRPAPPPPPRPRTRRDLADADARAGGTADVPPVPTDVHVHRGDPETPDRPSDEDLFAAAAEQSLTSQPPRPEAPERRADDDAEWAWLTRDDDGPAAPTPRSEPSRTAGEVPEAPAPAAEPPPHEVGPPADEPTTAADEPATTADEPSTPAASAPAAPAPAAAGPAAPAAPRSPVAPSPGTRPPVAGGRSGRGRLPGDATLDDAEVAAAGRAVVRRALDEDLGVGGDVTSLSTVPPDAVGRATVVARSAGVVAGVDLVALVYDHLDPRVSVEAEVVDGAHVRAGQALLRLAGPLRSVLTGERTALNLMTHLSGVATLTAAYVAAVEGTGCVVRDTRKTTPGLRLLEKAAVRAAGGVNHRIGLSDALLVKDNHVAAAGGVGSATRAALAGAEGRHVQVEVDSMAELNEALDAGARDVLLDNFDVDETRRAVDHVRQREPVDGPVLLETSGGVTLDTVRAYAETGVDRIAVGALTHSAPQLDIALDVTEDRDPDEDRRLDEALRPDDGSGLPDEARRPDDGSGLPSDPGPEAGHARAPESG
jgi:nicotinate-nucleotide pyrophosphorylase (carboxylating)